MSRLLVVSNRAPIEVARAPDGPRLTRTVGGLAGALDAALRAHGGVWVAWVGAYGDDEVPAGTAGLAYPIRVVHLREREVNNYYNGFANQVLWPLCHSFPGRCSFQGAYWTAYRQANERFAATVQSAAQPGDVVWIHDFHLCLVPGLLRASALPLRLGVFWHIPFPAPSVFGILRWRAELLTGLLGADLIGFQTDQDARNFLESVRQFLELPVTASTRRIILPGREVQVTVLPIGIDHASFRAEVANAAVRARAARLRETLRADIVMLGVDRLDYTKGIPERLQAFERFLERRPELRRRVCFVQVAVPSRDRVPEYRALKRAIDETVGRIAGRFTHEGRSPVQYLYTALGREHLAAYYLASDIAVVTPLRDGMNLVAKEYVACRGGDDGVLVLSEFAGAAQDLREAVIVNPYDPEDVRRGLETAVAMPPGERRRRMHVLDRQIASRDLGWWTAAFLDRLNAAGTPTASAA